MEVDKSKLTFTGSMNYILQILPEEDSGEVQVDQYQPRRNTVWTGNMSKDKLRPEVEETIERMKIAILHLQEYLDGKRDTVYCWELENETYNK
jgi:hypothetical protein